MALGPKALLSKVQYSETVDFPLVGRKVVTDHQGGGGSAKGANQSLLIPGEAIHKIIPLGIKELDLIETLSRKVKANRR